MLILTPKAAKVALGGGALNQVELRNRLGEDTQAIGQSDRNKLDRLVDAEGGAKLYANVRAFECVLNDR